MHEAGTLEIIFCLTGTIKFAYAYEEFTLNAGEYVSVDRDAYYLHSNSYNMCVSFYVDLMWFEKKSEFMRKVSIGFRQMLSYIRANKSDMNPMLSEL